MRLPLFEDALAERPGFAAEGGQFALHAADVARQSLRLPAQAQVRRFTPGDGVFEGVQFAAEFAQLGLARQDAGVRLRRADGDGPVGVAQLAAQGHEAVAGVPHGPREGVGQGLDDEGAAEQLPGQSDALALHQRGQRQRRRPVAGRRQDHGRFGPEREKADAAGDSLERDFECRGVEVRGGDEPLCHVPQGDIDQRGDVARGAQQVADQPDDGRRQDGVAGVQAGEYGPHAGPEAFAARLPAFENFRPRA